jgi:hypothetical protein
MCAVWVNADFPPIAAGAIGKLVPNKWQVRVSMLILTATMADRFCSSLGGIASGL